LEEHYDIPVGDARPEEQQQPSTAEGHESEVQPATAKGHESEILQQQEKGESGKKPLLLQRQLD
jgi:hypothetical protein